ncbi:uncharacterized protein LOC127867704 isoform X4 [Dreissena polymorpha]|uniref:SET domain-containing protein n=1 Tax=Dreissena polymorpha TaxID=45954 RepID=A0A9D4NEL2_DREPO|nr:uncharacterized protein LOC127867704 isoform X4 [Dreissena polymorpha]KAH3853001.1 hypothetical protein DPMN_095524 [Dreissena polymorpha]KAH3893990.1 hypothetical protein DPMN_018145 [Dreissena polymorpha]
MKIVEVNQTPHLCTFADRDIAIGEELRYDYGVPTLPWRKATQWLLDLRTARNQDKQHPYTRKKSIRRNVRNKKGQHNDYYIYGQPGTRTNNIRTHERSR